MGWVLGAGEFEVAVTVGACLAVAVQVATVVGVVDAVGSIPRTNAVKRALTCFFSSLDRSRPISLLSWAKNVLTVPCV